MISIKNVRRISSTRLCSFGYSNEYTTKVFLGSGVLVNCRHFLVHLYIVAECRRDAKSKGESNASECFLVTRL